MEFGVSSPMFTVLGTLGLLNLFCFGVEMCKLMTGAARMEMYINMAFQIWLCVAFVIINLPLYEGMLLGEDKGKMPSYVTLKHKGGDTLSRGLGYQGTKGTPMTKERSKWDIQKRYYSLKAAIVAVVFCYGICLLGFAGRVVWALPLFTWDIFSAFCYACASWFGFLLIIFASLCCSWLYVSATAAVSVVSKGFSAAVLLGRIGVFSSCLPFWCSSGKNNYFDVPVSSF
ncbi:glycosyltransferase 2 [Ancistrocladus abbreviatus]